MKKLNDSELIKILKETTVEKIIISMRGRYVEEDYEMISSFRTLHKHPEEVIKFLIYLSIVFYDKDQFHNSAKILASHWKRKKITTLEEAINYIKPLMRRN